MSSSYFQLRTSAPRSPVIACLRQVASHTSLNRSSKEPGCSNDSARAAPSPLPGGQAQDRVGRDRQTAAERASLRRRT